VDAEKSPKISARYHVRSSPSIITFQGSQVVDMLPGYQEKGSLTGLLDALIAGSAGVN